MQRRLGYEMLKPQKYVQKVLSYDKRSYHVLALLIELQRNQFKRTFPIEFIHEAAATAPGSSFVTLKLLI